MQNLSEIKATGDMYARVKTLEELKNLKEYKCEEGKKRLKELAPILGKYVKLDESFLRRVLFRVEDGDYYITFEEVSAIINDKRAGKYICDYCGLISEVARKKCSCKKGFYSRPLYDEDAEYERL